MHERFMSGENLAEFASSSMWMNEFIDELNSSMNSSMWMNLTHLYAGCPMLVRLSQASWIHWWIHWWIQIHSHWWPRYNPLAPFRVYIYIYIYIYIPRKVFHLQYCSRNFVPCSCRHLPEENAKRSLYTGNHVHVRSKLNRRYSQYWKDNVYMCAL